MLSINLDNIFSTVFSFIFTYFAYAEYLLSKSNILHIRLLLVLFLVNFIALNELS